MQPSSDHRGLSSLGELHDLKKKSLPGYGFEHGPSANIVGRYVCSPCMLLEILSERAVYMCCAHQAPKCGRAKTLAEDQPALVGVLCGTAISPVLGILKRFVSSLLAKEIIVCTTEH